ncbi:hypothetical protein AC1031_006909 [Aphanomyces cochlioides]|nr:hypothetical protein AC1031_006909 [Aphanomyces cochlioides]
MGWFGFGGKKEEEPAPISSFSESSYSEIDASSTPSYTPAISSTGGTSVNDIIMEEQQKVLIQQAIAKITAIAWEKCSASKPDTSLSISEISCIQNVTTSYLDSSVFIARKLSLSR